MEAEEEEDGDLDRDDDQDRAAQERVVVDRQALVEPQLEGEEPGERDDPRVDQQLQQAMSPEPAHALAATPTAERTTSTTSSCCSTEIVGQSGTEKFSRAARSVSGSEPGSLPRNRMAGWRCKG